MGQKDTLEPGDIINRTYEVVRLLGSGYSGTVNEVRHLHLPASLALKRMHPADRDNEHKASRFRAEAGTLFRLQHPNVVRIVDANETDDGLFFIVMELLAGETLAQRLTRGPLHPLRALKYAYDVACGLDAAHEIGVVHRDIKPDNLFITRDDIVKLLDFTAAKFFLAGLRTTEPAARVGTAAFMSPEHIDGKTSDARLDQYSLALCVYCMLRGSHPFQRHFGNLYALMRAQSVEEPEPLAKVCGMPAWIDALLAPALEKTVDRRYPTMAHFRDAIGEAMRRLAREMEEGLVAFDVPLGEPPIDMNGDAWQARGSQQVYVAPVDVARQVTAPVIPDERVSVAPSALLTASQKAAALATAPRSTTAPVHTGAPRQQPTRSRIWLQRVALALTLLAATGLLWRWSARPAKVEIPVAAPSLPTRAPAEPAPPGPAVTVPSTASAPPPVASVIAKVLASKPIPLRAAREDREVIPAKATASSAPTTAPASTAPAPTASASTAPAPTNPAPTPSIPTPHRIFGTEN